MILGYGLALLSGTGVGAQRAIGIGVIGGTLTAVFIGIFMASPFFILVSRLGSPRCSEATTAEPALKPGE